MFQTLVWYTVLKLSQNENTELSNVDETRGSDLETIKGERKGKGSFINDVM